MTSKHRIVKDGDGWAITTPRGSTMFAPTWEDAMKRVADLRRPSSPHRFYIRHWLRRLQVAARPAA